MTLTEAARLFELPQDATPDQLQARYQLLRTRLEEKIETAPALYLKERHRTALANLNTAYDLLKLAGEVLVPGQAGAASSVSEPNSSAPASAPAPAPVSPPPAAPVAPRPVQPAPAAPAVSARPAVAPAPVAPVPAPAAPVQSGGKRGLVIAAVLGVVVIGGAVGGNAWLKQKNAAAAETERTHASLLARQTDARTRWEHLEAEATAAEGELARLKAELDSAQNLAAPALAELQARHRAQNGFVAWLVPALAESPAKGLLARLDAAVAGQAPAGSAPTEADVQAALAHAEQELGTEKARLLALGRPLNLVSEPSGLRYTLTDAYGRSREGVTPAAVEVPWGLTQVSIAPPAPSWSGFKQDLLVSQAGVGEVKAVFALATARITSTPLALAYDLTDAGGTVRHGITPADLENVPTGPATLKISRPGWPAIEQPVEVTAAGPNAFTAEFVPGALTLNSEPAGATVMEGDKTLGITPLTLEDLPPGEHVFHLKLSGYSAATVNGQVRARETAPVSVALQAIAELEPGKPYRVPQLGLELMPIRAGEFTMGSPATESEHNADETQHLVKISRDYWLGKYEVTQAEWRGVMGDDPSFFKGDRLPVEQVSWELATLFCQMLTGRERAAGRLPVGYEYVLPTEAQWEYACRAGSPASYAGTGILSDMGWYQVISEGKTHPVGRKQPNAWGLYDMHGNVWEWCSDWFAFYPAGPVTDPRGPATGTGRVNRGGAWGSVAASCRSAFRLNDLPGSKTRNLGFRLALVSTGKAATP